MIKHSVLNTGEIEVIADAVAEALAREATLKETSARETGADDDKKSSWWKKPAVFIPVLTALLGSPVVLHLVTAQAEPAQSPPAASYAGMTGPAPQNIEFGGRGQGGQRNQGRQGAQGRYSDRPFMARVTMTIPLRPGPGDKSGSIVMLEKGAALKISTCRRNPVVIDEMEGRWCQATYKDEQGKSHLGWVFNAYLNNDTES